MVTSPFVFIHTSGYSFIVALLFICSQESGRRGVFFVTTLKTWNNRRTAEVGFYLQTSRFCHEYMEVVRGLGEVVC